MKNLLNKLQLFYLKEKMLVLILLANIFSTLYFFTKALKKLKYRDNLYETLIKLINYV